MKTHNNVRVVSIPLKRQTPSIVSLCCPARRSGPVAPLPLYYRCHWEHYWWLPLFPSWRQVAMVFQLLFCTAL